MAITGIGYGNTVIGNPYQRNRTGNNGTATKNNTAFGIPAQKDTEKADVGILQKSSGQSQADSLAALTNASAFYLMETRLKSGILDFGTLDDGTVYEARYADNSTDENPIIQVRVTPENGKEKTIEVNVKEVDPTNATQLEMLAYLSHQDAQGKNGGTDMGSFKQLLERAENSSKGDMRAKNAQDFMSWRQNWRNLTLSTVELSADELTKQALKSPYEDSGVPYAILAKDGIIDYNGVIFVCDEEYKALRLGDTSDPKKCLNIPLSGGGSLIVNRDNLGDLARAIGMFSPEDVNLIMRAIAEDAKIQQMQNEIDEETSGLDIAENTGETKDIEDEEELL